MLGTAKRGARWRCLLGGASPAFAAGALVACACASGCSDPLQVYPIVGREYDVARDCLLEEGTLDVIEGTAPADCLEPRCLRAQDTGSLFVSAVCVELAGYQDFTESSPPDPRCEAAFEAWEEKRYCD